MSNNTVRVSEIAESITKNIGKVILGKDEIINKLLISILCSGHVLLEDIPGTGKTSLAKALARSVDCGFKRVQFTPDLLPSDVTGINFYRQNQESFVLKKGPVFTNILLADEINRATPRTQSSLLECMEEKQVTIDGETHKLDLPFLVIATQNPIETQGTFPLPEAQLDRFFIKLSIGYPSTESEREILKEYVLESPLESINAVVKKEDILECQRITREVAVSDAVRKYIVDVVNATRNDSAIRLGVSPRGSLALMRAAQGNAAVSGRDYVLPDDVKAMAVPVLSHRIICQGSNLLHQGTNSSDIINRILDATEIDK